MKKNYLDEFGSVRFITALTPDTYTRKIIIISTTWNTSGNTGQTATKQEEGLNYFDIDYNIGRWEILKKHTNFDEAMKFHNETTEKQKFLNCEELTSKL